MKEGGIMRYRRYLISWIITVLLGGLAFADFNAADVVQNFNSLNSGQGIVFNYSENGWMEYTGNILAGSNRSREIWVRQIPGTDFVDTSAYTASRTSGLDAGSNYFGSFNLSPGLPFDKGVETTGTLNFTGNSTQTSQGNVLTLGAAFLYKLYATGEFDAYFNSSTIPGGVGTPPPFVYGIQEERELSALDLQNAIRILMGIDPRTSSNNFTYLLTEYYTYNLGNPPWDPNYDPTAAWAFWTQTYDPSQYYDLMGDYSVFVVNATQNGSNAANFLYLTRMQSGGGGTVPEPATLLLWGLGAVGMTMTAIATKRKQKALRDILKTG